MSSFCTEHGTNYVRTCDACGVAAVERIAELKRDMSDQKHTPKRRRSSDWPIDEAAHDVIVELRGRLDKAETCAGEAMERENAAIAQRDKLAAALRELAEARAQRDEAADEQGGEGE